jgi:hypothetical protein
MLTVSYLSFIYLLGAPLFSASVYSAPISENTSRTLVAERNGSYTSEKCPPHQTDILVKVSSNVAIASFYEGYWHDNDRGYVVKLSYGAPKDEYALQVWRMDNDAAPLLEARLCKNGTWTSGPFGTEKPLMAMLGVSSETITAEVFPDGKDRITVTIYYARDKQGNLIVFRSGHTTQMLTLTRGRNVITKGSTQQATVKYVTFEDAETAEAILDLSRQLKNDLLPELAWVAEKIGRVVSEKGLAWLLEDERSRAVFKMVFSNENAYLTIADTERLRLLEESMNDPQFMDQLNLALNDKLALHLGTAAMESITQALLIKAMTPLVQSVYGQREAEYFEMLAPHALYVANLAASTGAISPTSLSLYGLKIWASNLSSFTKIGVELDQARNSGNDLTTHINSALEWNRAYTESLISNKVTGSVFGDHEGMPLTDRVREIFIQNLEQSPSLLEDMYFSNNYLKWVQRSAEAFANSLVSTNHMTGPINAIDDLGILDTPANSLSVRLPFPDGTYVTDPALCRQKPEQWIEARGDSVALMVRNIEGSKFDNGYETFCEVRNVVQNGNNVKFRLVCESEGETNSRSESLIKVDDRAFKIGNRTFTSCGKLIR